MALNISISGNRALRQGQQTTLTANVSDDSGAVLSGIKYRWTTDRGAFVGATDQPSATFLADFASGSATIKCAITASAVDPISGPSLTSLTELTITGQSLNILVTAPAAPVANQNSIVWSATEAVGTIDPASDRELTSDINVYRCRWNTTGSSNPRFILNSLNNAPIGDYFRNNADKSVFLVFDDGSFYEITHAMVNPGAQPHHLSWNITDANTIAKMNALGPGTALLIGVGDAGSIGDTDTATGQTTVQVQTETTALSIEAIDEQFITFGTEDYLLLIDIGGNPDSVTARGHAEGFYHNWDPSKSQLAIKADEVTRLISGVHWDIEAVEGDASVTSTVKYNVVPAAPIFASLPTLHLYKGVQINWDIIIAHIPSLVVPNLLLLGIKSELREYGLNFRGLIPTDANFTFDSGNVTLIVPSETGETSDMHDYPFVIESGTPPKIENVEFRARGNYGELTFPEVQHAISYEWMVEEGDDPTWHLFDSTRQIINPRDVQVTPGNLNVTLKFPNVPSAARYAYLLESETHNVPWTEFVGVLENNMITTIIPDLEEGVIYKLHLRVASPWVGPPISIQITGGRIAYAVTDNNANSAVYTFSTGVPDKALSPALKTILLPTGNENPAGIAVSGTTIYCADNTDKAVYVFSSETADGARAALIKKINLPVTTGTVYDIAIYNGLLYLQHQHSFNSQGWDVYTIDANTSNSQTGTVIDRFNLNYYINSRSPYRLSVDEDHIYAITAHLSSRQASRFQTFPRQPIDTSDIDFIELVSLLTSSIVYPLGFSVVGNTAYMLNPRGTTLNGLLSWDRSVSYVFPSNVPKSIQVPFALNIGGNIDHVRGLDIPV